MSKNVCRFKQHSIQVALYMVSYPKHWNLLNSDSEFRHWIQVSVELHVGEESTVRVGKGMGPEPVWKWQCRGDLKSLFIMKPKLINMRGTRAI